MLAEDFEVCEIWTPSQVYSKDFVCILIKNYKIAKKT